MEFISYYLAGFAYTRLYEPDWSELFFSAKKGNYKAEFGIFASLGALMLKEMGVGLAAAVFIDATIVRAVLLPATMKLLGDWNWYLPKWLEWLPRVTPEHGTDLPPEPEPARRAREEEPAAV